MTMTKTLLMAGAGLAGFWALRGRRRRMAEYTEGSRRERWANEGVQVRGFDERDRDERRWHESVGDMRHVSPDPTRRATTGSAGVDAAASPSGTGTAHEAPVIEADTGPGGTPGVANARVIRPHTSANYVSVK